MNINFKLIGKVAFLVGIIFSMAAAFIPVHVPQGLIISLLSILGLIVGFFNIARENDREFLIAVIALLVIGLAGIETTKFFGNATGSLGAYLEKIFRNYTIFVATAGLVIAKKVIFRVN